MNGNLLKVAQARLCGGEYDYATKFDAKQYLATYYSDNAYAETEFEYDLLTFQLESLHYIFQKILADKENSDGGYDSDEKPVERAPLRRLLDVGSGPSLHAALGASLVFDEIFLSDVSPGCRRELCNFLEYDAHAFDWTSVAKAVADLEGSEDEVVLERVREKVKEVVACNVLDSEIIPRSCGQFDAISCLFCLESACDTHRQFANACCNMLKRLKGRGTFVILGGLLNSTYYDAGGGRMYRNLAMTKQEVADCLRSNGVEVEQWFEFQTPFDEISRPRTSHSSVYYICYGIKKR